MIIDRFFNSNKLKEDDSFENIQNSEQPIRSIVKAISWRIVGTLDTMIISWVITGELVVALSIGLVEVITKMILYYGHERVWNSIKWRK